MSKLLRMRPLTSIIATCLVVPLLTGSCKEAQEAAGDAAKQCGLECSAKGVADGNFAISGVAGVDAFFAAVVNFDSKAKLVSGNIQAELDAIAVSVGLQPGAASADIKAAIVAKFHLDATAGIQIAYQPAKCDVSAQAVVEAQAKCEGTVTPPSATVECKGSCEVQASATATCDASAKMVCHGTAPQLTCSGTCQGSCQLTTAAACSGTCNGTCTGTCSATAADGTTCAGKCDGTCQGRCELTAAGSCSGKCEGECAYTPPSGSCEAGARVECQAAANASVQCNGKCEGDFTPPAASVECQASAKAEAKVSVECTPPDVAVVYKFDATTQANATARADAEAQIEAWLVSFRGHMGKIAAQIKQAGVVLEAGQGVAEAATGVTASVNATLSGNVSLKTKVGLGCAVVQLPIVAQVVTGATTTLQAKLTLATQFAASLGSS